LIRYDVDIYDNIDMRWCYYWWMLIWHDVVVVVVDNVIEWHGEEMMLMVIMTLRWDVVDVENVIVMMYVVYVHGGCKDHDGYP